MNHSPNKTESQVNHLWISLRILRQMFVFLHAEHKGNRKRCFYLVVLCCRILFISSYSFHTTVALDIHKHPVLLFHLLITSRWSAKNLIGTALLILIDDSVYPLHNTFLHLSDPLRSPAPLPLPRMKMILETKWDLKLCVWQVTWWQGLTAASDPWKFYANNTAGPPI